MKSIVLFIPIYFGIFNLQISNHSPQLLAVQLQYKNYTEKEKIELLIKSIEDLKGAFFWRNSNYYDAKAAADHLRMKWGKAGNSIKTARDFIDKIASKSSMSGIPYRIKFADGKEVETKMYFNQKLKELEQNK
jgi:hypothetical protein